MRFFIFLNFSICTLIIGAQCSSRKSDTLTTLSKSPITPEIQSEAAQDVIKRLIPDKAQYFKIKVEPKYMKDGKDKFTILNKDGYIEIVGSSGLAVVWGFHYYIKYFCNSHIGWQVRQINIPDSLPYVNVTVVAKDRFRYYQNVCTTSYSFVWWDLNKWQDHIDWMALNGINIALAPHGQEAIWERIYKSLNLTDDEIHAYFAGPAFLSWQRMGNIRGWGGPLSSAWHQHSLNLQMFIVNKMKNLGMIPALPAFAGFVPHAFKRIYPDADLSHVEPWNKFSQEFCCPLYLSPTDTLFGDIGKLFLTEVTKAFGYSHIYYSDPFNEIKPTSDNITFLEDVGKSTFKSMVSVDPDAIWLLQNWMFVHESFYWTSEKVKAFLTSVPKGKMLVLDLQSEQWPQYEKFHMYYGQPFIWCMLHDFGGTLGMFGNSHSVNNDVYRARNSENSTMVGIGLTPEGINQNYVMYDLTLESSLRNDPLDLNDWVKNYTRRRYGKSNENAERAWNILMASVYNFQGLNKIRGKYAITRQPSLEFSPWAWYKEDDLIQAWTLLLDAHVDLNSSIGYKHDLVDLTRQVLQYKGDQIYSSIVFSFKKKNLNDLISYSQLLLDIFTDLDEILASNKDFLLGNWLESAKQIASSQEEKELYEYNARNQITLWGPNGEIIDYANKQWAGLIADYYAPRWNLFLTELKNCLINDIKFNKTKVNMMMFNNVESPFTFSKKIYPVTEKGESIKIAQKMYDKILSMKKMQELPSKVIPKNSLRTDYKGNRLRREFHEIEDEEKGMDLMEPHVILIN